MIEDAEGDNIRESHLDDAHGGVGDLPAVFVADAGAQTCRPLREVGGVSRKG